MSVERWFYTLPLRIQALFRRNRVEKELDDELRYHVEELTRQKIQAGLPPEEARQAALRSMGGVEQHKEECRDARGVSFIEHFFYDLKFALRALRKSPGFAAVAILSLALGTGANTAIFQLLDAVRLRSLPIADPQQLVRIDIADATGISGHFTGDYTDASFAMWSYLRDHQPPALRNVAAWGGTRWNVSPAGEAHYVHGLFVSGQFFDIVGVKPLIGRLFTPADDQPGCAANAIVSYGFWQREFSGRRSVLGDKITIEGHPSTIVGVTPQQFFGLEIGRNFDVAVPLCAEPLIDTEAPAINSARFFWLAMIGRLNTGISATQASAQLAGISPALFRYAVPPQYDTKHEKSFFAFKLEAKPIPAGFSHLRGAYQDSLWLLLWIAGVVLLIACANLANLLLARASARQREFAVRVALGAQRGRLIRQNMAESLLLAVLGTTCGALMAQALSRFLVSFISASDAQVFLELGFDWRMLGFTAALATLTCILFGLAPALQGSQAAPIEAMKAGGRMQDSGGGLRFRRTLVVVQVALSLVLLFSALLFTRSLGKLLNVDTGFQQEHLVAMGVDFSALKLPMKQRITYKGELLERMRSVPGVVSASDVFVVPVLGGFWNDQVVVPGFSDEQKTVDFNQIGPTYFRTMGIPLLAGRDFDDRDTATSQRVAVVDDTFVQKILGNADAIGRSFRVLRSKQEIFDYQIIGVTKATRYEDLREAPKPIAYIARTQAWDADSSSTVMVRTAGSDEAVIGSLRSAIAEFSPTSVISFRVFRPTLREGLLRERLMATLSGFFGFLAAALAMVGLYGLISYMVARRRHEIGVRMALGATAHHIRAMVLRHALLLLGLGLVIGLALAVGAAPALRSLIFGLQPTDPPTLLFAGALLACIALLASAVPAVRAARLDPMVALRDE
jgi:putative ABC transport system permease protein